MLAIISSDVSAATKTHQPLAVLVEAEPAINLVVVYNPLDISDRTCAELFWFADKPLSEYLDGLPANIEWAVGLNGCVVKEADWSTTILEQNDFLTLVPVLHGGGGDSKSIMRIVAMIGIAVLAAFTGGLAAGAMGFVAGEVGFAVTSAVVSSIITMAGSMLVNSLLGTGDDTGDSTGDETSTYGIDGAKNTITEDVVVPVVYGMFRVGGNLTHIRTDNVDDTQYLYLQAVVSEGVIENMSDFKIDEEDATSYSEVETMFTTGTDSQAVSEWFTQTVTMVNKGVKLSDTEWVEHETTSEIDQFRVDVTFPYGLTQYDDEGNRSDVSVPINIEYSADGWNWMAMTTSSTTWSAFSGASSGDAMGITVTVNPTSNDIYGAYSVTAYYRCVGNADWIEMGTDTGTMPLWGSEYGNEFGTIEKTFQVSGLAAGSYEVSIVGGSIVSQQAQVPSLETVTASSTQPLRRSFTSEVLAEGVYTIRVKRGSVESTDDQVSDEVYVTDIVEIITDPVRYAHTAYYGIKVRLTDQFNSIPTVTALVTGKKVATFNHRGEYLGHVWSDNPAWVSLDILTNTRYGGNMVLSRFDMPRWYEWAQHCETYAFKFNGVVDYKTTVWDAVQTVCLVGHAQIVVVGTKFSLAIERNEAPVMMFSVANMVKDSFSTSWLPMEDRANEIEIEYYNEEEDYARKSVRVVDYDAITRGTPQRISTLTMTGISKESQAIFEGQFRLALNKYLQQTVSFEAPLEAIACSVGDIVLVQHDIPQWGFGGKLAHDTSSTTTKLYLDRPVTMIAGKTYRAMIHHSAIKRRDAFVQAVVGQSVYVAGAVTPSEVKRLRFGTLDTKIAVVSPGTWVELFCPDLPAGVVAPGATVELWDTDVLDEVGVVLKVGETQELTLSQPLLAPPAMMVNWLFGEVERINKPFRIIKIRGSHEYTRTIDALEFNASVYEDPANVVVPINPSGLNPGMAQISVSNIIEEVLSDTGLISRCNIYWHKPAYGIYGGADVYIGRNSTTLALVGTASNGATAFAYDARPGDTLNIKLVAYDVNGTRLSYDQATVYVYLVIGKTSKPGTPRALKATGGFRQISLSWVNPSDLDLKFIEVWESITPNLEDATKVADVAGNSFVRAGLGGLETRWYWVRAVNISRVIGDFNSNLGTQATSYQLTHDDLAGQIIDESKLYPELLERIDAIDATKLYEQMNLLWGDTPGQIETVAESVIEGLVLGHGYWAEYKLDKGSTDQRMAVVDTAIETLLTDTQSLASQITIVAAEFDGQVAVVNQQLIALAQADSAAATLITTLETKVDDNYSLVQVELTSLSNTTESLATQIITLGAQVGTDITAAIQTEQTTRASADQALSSSLTTLASRMTGAEGAIQIEQTARANADASLASQITTLTSTVGSNTTSVQQVISSVSGLEGKYTVKVDNNGYIAGFGLAVYPNQYGATTSEFIILADKFAVVQPGYSSQVPFVIGQVNGVARVSMSSAFIQDAAITNAKIQNAAITNAKIHDLTVDTIKITNGSISSVTSGTHGGLDARFLGWRNLCSVGFSISYGGSVTAISSLMLYAPSSGSWRILVDGADATGPMVAAAGYYSNGETNVAETTYANRALSFWVSSGYHTVTIQAVDCFAGPNSLSIITLLK